ncbi:MAG: SPOR domain-containing protein [Nitrospiraceae bacterium]|nr:SPOR domain-containing protein [Nitrospiraceae bacterium]
MSGPGTKEQPSPMVAGKGVIIGITVFFSCLSLTLGFFIGRYGAPRPAVPAVPVDLQAPLASSPAPAQLPTPAEPPKPATVQEDTARAVPENMPKSAQSASEPVKPVVEPATPAVPQAKEPAVSLPAPAGQAKRSPRAHETGPATDSLQPKQEKVITRFTVQIGAFRSKTEADRFKAKYSGKGYKIYIHTVKANRTMKIYKVRTGTFTDKREAELLALKLKKTDGLHAFVTPAGD